MNKVYTTLLLINKLILILIQVLYSNIYIIIILIYVNVNLYKYNIFFNLHEQVYTTLLSINLY